MNRDERRKAGELVEEHNLFHYYITNNKEDYSLLIFEQGIDPIERVIPKINAFTGKVFYVSEFGRPSELFEEFDDFLQYLIKKDKVTEEEAVLYRLQT